MVEVVIGFKGLGLATAWGWLLEGMPQSFAEFVKSMESDGIYCMQLLQLIFSNSRRLQVLAM
jgi:hypothetical protein